MISFSVHKIVAAAGGTPRLLKLLARWRQPVPEASAVSQWKVRNTLPRVWTAPVLFVLQQDGVNLLPLYEHVPATRSAVPVPARGERDDDPFADDDPDFDPFAAAHR